MNRPEQAIQRGIVQFIKLAHPNLLVFAVPNGGGRSAVEAAIFKGQGVLAGVADLVVVMPGGRVGFLEVKADKGRASASQKAFAEQASKLGAPHRFVRSIEDVQDALSVWLHSDLAQPIHRAKLASAGDCSR